MTSNGAGAARDHRWHVASPYAHLQAKELLGRPPTVLLGVPGARQPALHAIGVDSVFDLAPSGSCATRAGSPTAAISPTRSSPGAARRRATPVGRTRSRGDVRATVLRFYASHRDDRHFFASVQRSWSTA
jgi:hypothetical protein